MAWYAAHVILYTKFKEGRQNTYPVWENVYLVEASSHDEALAKAMDRGKEDEGDSDGSYTYGGRPATWVLAGVRKTVECGDLGVPPEDGTEITYSEFEVDSIDNLTKLVNGDDIFLLYEG